MPQHTFIEKLRWRLMPDYRDPLLTEARAHVHADLQDMDARVAAFRGAKPEIRRATQAILRREIELRKPGKRSAAASSVLGIVIAAVTVIAATAAAWLSGWMSIFGNVMSANGGRVTTADAHAFGSVIAVPVIIVAFSVALLLAIVYFIAGSAWGVDKERAVATAWLELYQGVDDSRNSRSGWFFRRS